MGITTGHVAENAHPCGVVWLEAAQDFALLPASGGAGGSADLQGRAESAGQLRMDALWYNRGSVDTQRIGS
jgi:hypothetical protein